MFTDSVMKRSDDLVIFELFHHYIRFFLTYVLVGFLKIEQIALVLFPVNWLHIHSIRINLNCTVKGRKGKCQDH